MTKLVLASASPRRLELLGRVLTGFEVDPADLDESVADRLPPRERPGFLARQKALAVAARRPGDLVLGCDTGVLLDGVLLGKPRDAADAVAMLRSLSGRTHRVITGCCLAQNGLSWTSQVTTRVVFLPLREEQIAAYVATGEPLDKAGAYGIQGRAAPFVRSITGDYYNVVGLPLAAVMRLLRRAGWPAV